METQSVINTERLLLKPVSIADSIFILELLNTKGWIEFIGNRNVQTNDQAIKYIEQIIEKENIVYWIVKLMNNETPVGVITLIKRSYLDYPDIGFAFLPQYTNCGYAFEAAKSVLNQIKNETVQTFILATTNPDNIKSIKLIKKLEFTFNKEIIVDNTLLCVYQYECFKQKN